MAERTARYRRRQTARLHLLETTLREVMNLLQEGKTPVNAVARKCFFALRKLNDPDLEPPATKRRSAKKPAEPAGTWQPGLAYASAGVWTQRGVHAYARLVKEGKDWVVTLHSVEEGTGRPAPPPLACPNLADASEQAAAMVNREDRAIRRLHREAARNAHTGRSH